MFEYGKQMADIAQLTRMIEPEAQALGFDLVRVKLFGGAGDVTLQVMAERPDTRQLTIEDCAELSRRVSDVLDAEDPIESEYRLEVSSPGIDRPLTRRSDYADWAGHEARLVLAAPIDGRKQYKGELIGIDGEIISITLQDGSTVTVAFAQVADAKLLFTDKLLAATRPLDAEGADEFEEISDEVLANDLADADTHASEG